MTDEALSDEMPIGPVVATAPARRPERTTIHGTDGRTGSS